jgi:hypothetical protein
MRDVGIVTHPMYVYQASTGPSSTTDHIDLFLPQDPRYERHLNCTRVYPTRPRSPMKRHRRISILLAEPHLSRPPASALSYQIHIPASANAHDEPSQGSVKERDHVHCYHGDRLKAPTVVKRVSRTGQWTYDHAWRALQCPFASGCTPVTIHLPSYPRKTARPCQLTQAVHLRGCIGCVIGRTREKVFISPGFQKLLLQPSDLPFSAGSAGIPHSYPL